MVKTLEGDRYALCEKHVIVPFCCSYQVYRYLAGCFGFISCRHYLEYYLLRELGFTDTIAIKKKLMDRWRRISEAFAIIRASREKEKSQ